MDSEAHEVCAQSRRLGSAKRLTWWLRLYLLCRYNPFCDTVCESVSFQALQAKEAVRVVAKVFGDT